MECDLCNHGKISETLCQNFIESRINRNIVNLWSLMKKANIKTGKHMGQSNKRRIRNIVKRTKRSLAVSCLGEW